MELYNNIRKGGRVVEYTGLENQHAANEAS